MTKVLDGKLALVTGASRGIGRAIAERLARDGATVAVNYARSADEAATVVAGIGRGGGQAFATRADISRIDEIRNLFRALHERHGRLDIVVNNAALLEFASIAETGEANFDRSFALNVRGPFFVMQEAARRLADGGRIVNISSSATTVGLPGLGTYLAGKAALEQLSLVAANELGPRGITVNSVLAGVTETQMLDELMARWPPEMRAALIARTPLGRVGQPAEIADVVAFLAGPDARWITGQGIRADGGVR